MLREPPSVAGRSMSDATRDKVVYDCNVYLQFLFNRNGPSGRCVSLALDGHVQLFVSDAVLVTFVIRGSATPGLNHLKKRRAPHLRP
jgi:hypothetical protein